VSEPNLNERFAASMGALLGPDFPRDIALAVSGGGDSMAMLALTHDWARHMGIGLWVVTVDHGLRPESAEEAAMVATECAALGHPHATLRWQWDGTGNLQDAARRARLRLIDRWRRGIEHVLMAHTQDDVAETFLMRLARGSGVEGLSAIAAHRYVRPHNGGYGALPEAEMTQRGAPPPEPTRRVAGVPAFSPGFHVIRPLLEETRADLRHYLRTLRVPFVEDPSNEDPKFDRVRARAALAEIGIDTSVMAATAQRMARAREALGARAKAVAERVVEQGPHGTLRIDRDGFAKVERDTQLRLMAAALQWVGGVEYRPRAAPLEGLLDRALAGGGGTLHGAQVDVMRDKIVVFREFAAVSKKVEMAGPSSLWDKRWKHYGPHVKGLEIRALGDEGWQQMLSAERDVATTDGSPEKPRPSHAVARALPAVFDGDQLVGFVPCSFGIDYVAELRPPHGHFLALLNPH
jgi:tRNA(Ile)-lysidine synthase